MSKKEVIDLLNRVALRLEQRGIAPETDIEKLRALAYRLEQESKVNKMEISKEERGTILEMYDVVCGEGQESNIMVNLVRRIKKEKNKPIHIQTEEERVSWTAKEELEEAKENEWISDYDFDVRGAEIIFF